MSYGLLRGEFRPGDEVCPLRSYARQMRRLTGDRSRCVLHMQKALTEMNVRLDSVIPNITGLTGQRILPRDHPQATGSHSPRVPTNHLTLATRRRRLGGGAGSAGAGPRSPCSGLPLLARFGGRGRGIDFVDPRDLRPLAALDDLASDGRALGKREPAGARHHADEWQKTSREPSTGARKPKPLTGSLTISRTRSPLRGGSRLGPSPAF